MRNKRRGHEDEMRLERHLQALRRESLRDLHDHLSRTRSASAHDATEFLDLVADGELDDMAARIAEWDSTTVDEIDDALRTLREGSYGICRPCGKKIPERRLEAVPFATLCVKCKQVQERQCVPSGLAAARSYGADISVDIDGSDKESAESTLGELFRELKFSDIA